MPLSPPQLLTGAHDITAFHSGKAALDDWLVTHALANQAKGFSRVIAVCDGNRVVGFYSLAPTAVSQSGMPRSVRTGRAPEPVPCILLGQFAVDRNWQGRGIGSGLLQDALKRAIGGAAAIGGRALVVRAIDAEAEAYWRSNGFAAAPDDPSILFRTIEAVARDLELPR